MNNSLIVTIISTQLLVGIACDPITDPGEISIPLPDVDKSTVYPGHTYTFIFVAVADDPFAVLTKKAFIIKADDLKDRITEGWQKYFNLIASYGIHSSVGVITQYFEHITDKDIDQHVALIEYGVEYWHHGWDHQLPAEGIEFQGTSYDHQYTHLRAGIDIIKEKLDYTIHSFGAPGNAWDSTTVNAIANISEIKVWLHGTGSPDKLSIPICTIMEHNTHYIYDLETMISRFNNYQDLQAVMFQIHPDAWSGLCFS